MQVFNASEEEALADKYPNIRLFTAALVASDTPEQELLAVEQKWSVANSSEFSLSLSLSFLLTPFSLPAISSPESVGGGNWTYFSATCWFYGRTIYDVVQYPIGLVDTDWGGTPVEAWSSPDALAKCGKKTSPRSHIFSVEILDLVEDV